MKAGDLVTFKNLSSWPPVGLITSIHITNAGTGQIYLIVAGSMDAAIPWVSRRKYIVEANYEDR